MSILDDSPESFDARPKTLAATVAFKPRRNRPGFNRNRGIGGKPREVQEPTTMGIHTSPIAPDPCQNANVGRFSVNGAWLTLAVWTDEQWAEIPKGDRPAHRVMTNGLRYCVLPGQVETAAQCSG